MEEWARSQTTINPDASGDAAQQALAAVAAATSEVSARQGRSGPDSRVCRALKGAHASGRASLCGSTVGTLAAAWLIVVPLGPCSPPVWSPWPPLQGKFLYTKFFAVGLFRLVELTGEAY